MSQKDSIQMAAYLIFLSYPFALLTSFLCGFLYKRLGRRIPVFIGFLFTSAAMGMVPWICNKIFPGVYLCMVLQMIGCTLILNAPLINDCIMPFSIVTALTFANIFRALGILCAIGGLF